MNNLYWGNNVSRAGGSFLLSKAIVNIQEGYLIGSTTEYVSQGNFEVKDYNYGSFNNNKLLLQLESPLENIKHTSSPYKIDFSQGGRFLEYFDNENALDNFITSNSSWGVSNSELRTIDTPETTVAMLSNGQIFSDFVCTFRLESTNIEQLGLFFRSDGVADAKALSGYFVQTRNALGIIQLWRVVKGSYTLLANPAFTTADNTKYWIKVICIGDQITLYTSTNGLAYTRLTSATDSTFKSGTIGFRSISAGVKIDKYDFVEVVDIKPSYTTDDLIKKGYAFAGNFNVDTPIEIGDFNNFTGSSGSTWGVSNTYLNLLNTTGGSLFHTYTTTGNSYSDFTFECDVKGTSGINAGIFWGVSANYYLNYTQFTTGSTVFNIINQQGLSNVTVTNTAPYLNLHHGIWYNFKMQKEAGFIRWFVNDKLSGYMNGSTFTSTDNQKIGLAVHKSGASGKYVEFKNPRLYYFDSKQEDASLDTNQSVYSFLNRVIPEGVDTITSGNNLEVLNYGISRGSLSLGTSSYIKDLEIDYSNSVGSKTYEVIGQDSYFVTGSTIARVKNQVNTAQYTQEVDLSLQNKDDSIDRANYLKADDIKNTETISIEINYQPTLQNYDFVNLVDNTSGISTRYITLNNSKYYSASDGNAGQRVTLGLYE